MAAATWTLLRTRTVKGVSASGTADAPASETDGMSLDAVGGVMVALWADAGQTLSGAGALRAYVHDTTVTTYAAGKVSFSTIVADNVVTIGGTAFTAKVSPSGDEEFALGANDAAALVNLAAKVNAHPAIGLLVQMNGTTGVITAVASGSAGNAITLAKTGTPITVSAATLTEGCVWEAVPDLDLSVTKSGRRAQSWADASVLLPFDRIAWVPDTVTVSAGGVTVFIRAVGGPAYRERL